MSQSLTTAEFIVKARKIHGNKYDYSKVAYINNRTKVCLICPIHGEFLIRPNNHLNGQGCKDCGYETVSKLLLSTNKEIISKFQKIHADKYDYSKVNYHGANSKVCIICKEHGEFWQRPKDHLHGQGCPKCALSLQANRQRHTLEQFVSAAREVHGDKYDYSKATYVNNHTKICITCPKHGEFWQTPKMHIKRKQECPYCITFQLETEVKTFLKRNNIKYIPQQRFDWLGLQSLDFYLPDYNIAIECQGIQHFEPVEFFGGKQALNETQERDLRKLNLCKEHGIKLLYYSECQDGLFLGEPIINSTEKLLKILMPE